MLRLIKTAVLFLVMCISFTSARAAEDSVYTKKMASEQLVKSGLRWQQSFSPKEEAESKLLQARAPTNVMVSAFAREFVARTSELMYGFSNTLHDMIGAGVSGIEGKYDFHNKAALSRIKAAEENSRLGNATTRQYQNDLKFLVLLRYLNAQQYQKKSEVVDLLLSKDSSLFHLATEKVKNGVGVPLDLARAEALVERDKFKKLDAEASYDKALQELKELLVELPPSIRLEKLTFHEIPAEELARLEGKATDRPEVKVAEYTLKAVSYLKESVDNEQKPVVSLYGEIGMAGTQFLGISATPSGAVGIQVSLPLFTGGYQQARSAEMLTKVNTANQQFQQVQLETKSQLETAKAQLEFARKVVNSANKQLELARKELQYAEHKIRIGSSSNIELINAQTNLATVLDLNVQALFAYEAAKLVFFHLIADVDSYLAFEQNKGVPHE